MADPDLQIRRGGGGGGGEGEGRTGHPDPEIRWGGGLQKFFFRPFGLYFSRKIREGSAPPRAPPLDPPLVS